LFPGSFFFHPSDHRESDSKFLPGRHHRRGAAPFDAPAGIRLSSPWVTVKLFQQLYILKFTAFFGDIGRKGKSGHIAQTEKLIADACRGFPEFRIREFVSYDDLMGGSMSVVDKGAPMGNVGRDQLQF
jgi:hypothetical protein